MIEEKIAEAIRFVEKKFGGKCVLQGIPVRISSDVESVFYDRHELMVNPGFVEGKSQEEINFVVAHIAKLDEYFDWIASKREVSAANMAASSLVNREILADNDPDFKAPESALVSNSDDLEAVYRTYAGYEVLDSAQDDGIDHGLSGMSI